MLLCGSFGASNFPLAFSTAGGDTASALAAGCSVVVKAHSGHMATADFVAQAIERAVEKSNMSKGVFNMIYGNGVGEPLVKHPLIQAVGFTGSLRGVVLYVIYRSPSTTDSCICRNEQY